MNRERGITGVNSYSKELSLNIIEYIHNKLKVQNTFDWLDICCGSGKALIETAQYLQRNNLQNKVKIYGIDLVDMFLCKPNGLSCLDLIAINIVDFYPNKQFDFITCVHGLHYIGDKLKLLEKLVDWLNEQGLFLANIDMNNFKDSEDKIIKRRIIHNLKTCGIKYDSRKHLLMAKGHTHIKFKYTFLGSDDQAVPNYTKQAVVNSYYSLIV